MTETEALALPFDDRAPGYARAFISNALGAVPECDDAVLIASELVSNAVRYGRAPLELTLEQDLDTVTIAVTHGLGDDRPHQRTPEVDRVGGYGLHLVDQVSTAWGWSEADGMLRTWARLER